MGVITGLAGFVSKVEAGRSQARVLILSQVMPEHFEKPCKAMQLLLLFS
jgi:hypothetical protein